MHLNSLLSMSLSCRLLISCERLSITLPHSRRREHRGMFNVFEKNPHCAWGRWCKCQKFLFLKLSKNTSKFVPRPVLLKRYWNDCSGQKSAYVEDSHLLKSTVGVIVKKDFYLELCLKKRIIKKHFHMLVQVYMLQNNMLTVFLTSGVLMIRQWNPPGDT